MPPTQADNNAVVPFPTPHAQPPAVADAAGYANVRFNALKHGVLSRYTVLSHEDRAEYESLLSALIEEHKPAGPTEAHLVEELAGTVWRKRRVLQAEGATINRGLKTTVADAERLVPAAVPFGMGLSGERIDLCDVVGLSPEEAAKRKREARHDLEATQRAKAILRRGGANAYEKALKALKADSRDWWSEYVQDGTYDATAAGLMAFIDEHLYRVCVALDKEASHHDAIKNQALGEGLQAHRLEKLNRYEVHLDRKFERTLAMLLKLKELRRGP